MANAHEVPPAAAAPQAPAAAQRSSLQPGTVPARRRWLVWAAYAGSAAVGLKLGWDFGFRLNGPWLATLTAVNGALLCSIVVGAFAEHLLAGRQPTQR